MKFISLKNITKSFNDVQVLKDITLEINEGETLGILGRSGSGKSVLINMLRGTQEYAPDSGQMIFHVAVCPKCGFVESPSKTGEKCPHCESTFESKDVDFWNSERTEFTAVKRRIAIMLQRNFALYDEASVIENVLKAMGDNDEFENNLAQALEILQMVQMSHRITHIARDLSGGEKQRVVLARADNVIWLEDGQLVKSGDPHKVVQEFLETVPLPQKVQDHEVGGPIVKLENVKKHYYSIERGVVKAVDDVDLEINQQEIFGLVGLSGAGKTTLTKMLTGLTEPSSGSLEVKVGDDWVDMTVRGPMNRGRAIHYIGLLHQEFSLYPHRDVLGNLSDAISLNLPAEFAKMQAIHVLEAVGFSQEKVQEILNKYPDELSAGERHRVAIAQVLIKEPNIIVLDEPTGTMDPITRVVVSDSILKAREELHQTFILVSHDMDFVLDVCDRAALMRDGSILDIGKPEEIVKQLTSDEKEDMLRNR